ncbi:MAG: hypothetical protein GWM98_04635 [Nitrospinaceae bacterium]|nr:hypothetical protein [Deltaproteobacteria bacterium]NIY14206.1 hypothetical protein [Nitrospinaceae bacterium]
MADPAKGFKITAGRFSARSSVGLQTVSGLEFEPELVLFLINSLTAPGLGTNADLGVGAMSAADQVYHAVSHTPKIGGTAYRHSRHDDTKAIGLIQSGASPSVLCAAELDSMLSDGFRLDWTTADGQARLIDFLAFSGLQNLKITQIQAPTSTGSQAYTGIGFQPTGVLFLSSLKGSDPPFTSAGAGFMYGHMFDFPASGARGVSVSTLAPKEGYGSPNQVGEAGGYPIVSPDGYGNLADRASYSSFDADGFTLNWSDVDGNETRYTAICFQSGPHIGGVVPTPTVTGEVENFADRPYRGLVHAFLNVYRWTEGAVHSGESSIGIGFFDLGPQVQHMRWFGFDGDNARQSLSNIALESHDVATGAVNLAGEVVSATNISAIVDYTVVESEEKFWQVTLFDSNLPIYAGISASSSVAGALTRGRGLIGTISAAAQVSGRLRIDGPTKGIGGGVFIPKGEGTGGKVIKG